MELIGILAVRRDAQVKPASSFRRKNSRTVRSQKLDLGVSDFRISPRVFHPSARVQGSTGDQCWYSNADICTQRKLYKLGPAAKKQIPTLGPHLRNVSRLRYTTPQRSRTREHYCWCELVDERNRGSLRKRRGSQDHASAEQSRAYSTAG